MTSKRSYHDACGMAHALNLVGERWALLVVRELVLGPRRFTDLRQALPGISANVLTQRLTELEGFGVVVRRRLDPPASAWVYDLTEWGHQLEPVIGKLGQWGARSPLLPRDAALSVNSFILSLRNMFDHAAADGVTLRVDLRVSGQPFHAYVSDGTFEADAGPATDPDVTIEGDQNDLASVVYDGRDLDEAVDAGVMRYAGERKTLERFLALFSLPAPAPVPASD
ncbi:winged helix-turn-helix transcriptional regulator [Solicola gregarius]|uniref:Winged helix-turn-helix transcriptional regulator n=1 Tax=Solicola gregarius TaxID=2908642 RepID=A0AA46YKI7_9ACTN|nr:winged helix-turn-helix transcriptional regulator [Solicola gregarius]UYM04619.1 winged helix-turn-helix transcriptional regulator [Solicola gregarius]